MSITMESYSYPYFLSGASSLLGGISGSSAFRRCGNLSVAVFWLFVSLWVSDTEGIHLQPIQDELVSFNRRILEHKASSACLTVNPDEYKLVLDNCDWDNRKAAEIEGTFAIIPSNPGGHLLRWTNGPKPSGTEACLSFPQEEDSRKLRDDKNEDILLSECDSRSPSQNWYFQRIPDSPGDERLFLIRKYGSESKCLGVNTEDNSLQLISKGPCNYEDPDQVWKICGTLTDTSLLIVQVVLFVERVSCLTFKDENFYLLHKEEDSSIEKNLLKEKAEDDEYIAVPLRNMRQIRVRSLGKLDEDVREDQVTAYKIKIALKNVSKVDTEMKEMEEELLERGYWPNCEWVVEMPPPFDDDEQCSKSELTYLLQILGSEVKTDATVELKL